MHLRRRKGFTELVQLLYESLAFVLAESTRRSPVTFLDLHAVSIQSRNKERQYASRQSVNLIHVIDTPKGET